MRIGLVGLKGSGKSTVANTLKTRYGFERMALADPMKECAELIFGWSSSYLDSFKELFDTDYGIAPREFLQVFGTDFAQHMLMERFPEFAKTTGRMIWVRNLLTRMHRMGLSPRDKVVVDDVRFPHEVEALKGNGFYIVRVDREGFRGRDQDSHESESYAMSLPVDHVLVNDGVSDLAYEMVDMLSAFRKLRGVV